VFNTCLTGVFFLATLIDLVQTFYNWI